LDNAYHCAAGSAWAWASLQTIDNKSKCSYIRYPAVVYWHWSRRICTLAMH
jgi:hypothetical protein